MPDLRDLLAAAADPPSETDLDVADLMARTARRRRRRKLAIAAPLTRFLLVAVLLGVRSLGTVSSVRFAEEGVAPSPQPTQPTRADSPAAIPPVAATPPAAVLDVPDDGEVEPAFLDDGTEMFVVNADGRVHVFDARGRGVVGAIAAGLVPVLAPVRRRGARVPV